ncbi:MAG: stage 0 sporulation protein [Clostridia bacterium]|nr:stage 0 sporulation protein [Clostridia bacterium]
MSNQITITIDNQGRRYYTTLPDSTQIEPGINIIVERDNTLEFATCVAMGIQSCRSGDEYKFLRIATPSDITKHNELLQKANENKIKVQKKVDQYNLQLKLISVNTSFDGSKLLVIYTAEERVDFRALVRDLASLFHTRIEMRQISEREATAIIGGVGTCGLEFCCAKHIRMPNEVGIKMAKTQGLALNPTKINGTCGKLLCCLQYEYDDYKRVQDSMPKLGETISTPDGSGLVVYHDLFNEMVAVKITKDDQDCVIKYTLQQLGKDKDDR